MSLGCWICKHTHPQLNAGRSAKTYRQTDALNAHFPFQMHACMRELHCVRSSSSSPSMEKMKSLAVWISSARWSSYSRCSCLLNSAISRLSSSILAPDLKSSSGACGTCLVLLGVAVGLFPAEPARLESAGAAMFARRRWTGAAERRRCIAQLEAGPTLIFFFFFFIGHVIKTIEGPITQN